MAINLTDIVKIYQENIDELIVSLGKDVVLHFEEIVENVSDGQNDHIRDGSLKYPSFKTQGPTGPTITETTTTIKALLKFNPKDYIIPKGTQIEDMNGVVRLKTFLKEVPDLKRCKYIEVSPDSSSIVYNKYRLVREPIPVGLKYDRYAISFWKMM